MRKVILALGFVLSPSISSAETYFCQVVGQLPGSWLGPDIVIGLDAAKDVAILADNVTIYAKQAPVKLKVGKNTDQVLKFKWQVEKLKDITQQYLPKMLYSAVLQKASGKMTIYAQPHGYSNSFGADATCKVVDKGVKMPKM